MPKETILDYSTARASVATYGPEQLSSFGARRPSLKDIIAMDRTSSRSYDVVIGSTHRSRTGVGAEVDSACAAKEYNQAKAENMAKAVKLMADAFGFRELLLAFALASPSSNCFDALARKIEESAKHAGDKTEFGTLLGLIKPDNLIADASEHATDVPFSSRHKWVFIDILCEANFDGLFSVVRDVLGEENLPLDELALGCAIAVRYYSGGDAQWMDSACNSLMTLAERALPTAKEPQPSIHTVIACECIASLASLAQVSDLPRLVQFLQSDCHHTLQLRTLHTLALILSREPASVLPEYLEPVTARCFEWLATIATPDTLKYAECFSEAAAITRAMVARLGPEMKETCRIIAGSHYKSLIEFVPVIVKQAREELECRLLHSWVQDCEENMAGAISFLPGH
jgi:hypothetical protein